MHRKVAIAIALLLPTAAMAEQSPAVSAPTLTVDGTSGSVGGSPSGFVSATGTLPIGDRFGFQLDGQLGQEGDRGQGGSAAHLFYRDPDAFMAGGTAMWARIGGWNVFRYGAEGEAYLGDFTIAPSAGLQRGDANKGTAPSGYGALDLSYYPVENVKLTLGGSGFANARDGMIEAEWQPTGAPLTLFAEVGGGNAGQGFALAGVRFTFGAPGSSLKQRDRHGDPINALTGVVAQSGGALTRAAVAVAQQKAAAGCVPVATRTVINLNQTSTQVATASPTISYTGCPSSPPPTCAVNLNQTTIQVGTVLPASGCEGAISGSVINLNQTTTQIGSTKGGA